MTNSSITLNTLRTPVLFIVFNRPDPTNRVFEAIRKAKPARLYVAADGPRQDRMDDIERVAKVRKIATAVDWPCEVKTLFREKNLGCKHGCSTAISWLFEHEEQGIILEDDCLPHQDFFYFCETLLNYYQKDTRILTIAGSNIQSNYKRGSESYYFSKYFFFWGWATWRRAWQCYDGKISFWPQWKDSEDWKKKFTDTVEKKYWKKVFDTVYSNPPDTWDYPFFASAWKKGGLSAVSSVNLISNIGFGEDATRTTNLSKDANLPVESIAELVHPKNVEQDRDKDRYVFDENFDGRHLRMPGLLFSFPRRTYKFLLSKIKLAINLLSKKK
jgi:hypothetical protein